MESKASNQQPKLSKFSSTSMQHAILVLPAELVTEILSRLLIKPLLRFRCTSKSWLALISSPEFVRTHLSLNANNKECTHHKVMMSCRTKYSFRDCSLSSLFNESVTQAKELDDPTKSYGKDRRLSRAVSIVGSVNGLICLVIKDKELFLWNPSIRKYKKLPDPTTIPRDVLWRAFGFGYDEIHDDYKVVLFTNRSRKLVIEIYSLKSDSWRLIEDCPCPARQDVTCKFLNRKLHWTANTGKVHLTTSPTGRGRCMIINIISIDLADEKWGEMEQPCNLERESKLRLGVTGSDLSVFHNCSHTRVDVWVMKEYGVKESWTKMLTIKYPEGLLWNHNLRHICLHMTNEGEILGGFGSTFMIFNPEGGLLRYSKVINFDSWGEPEIYVESLVCPFSTGGLKSKQSSSK